MKTVILHNIIAPYKTLLFNALHETYKDFFVLYASEIERRRDWDIKKDDMHFDYEVMFDRPFDDVSASDLFRKTWSKLNALAPDAVVADGYTSPSCWAGLCWAKMKKKKIILWSSSNEDDHPRTFWKEAVKKFFVKRCDAYNAYGTKSRDYLVTLGADASRVFITGNNTDNHYYFSQTGDFRCQRELLREKYGVLPNNFLFVGRFSPEKNIFRLIDSYTKAVYDNLKWGLILIGSGPLESKIKRYISVQKTHNVLVPGFQQKDTISRFFAISDVLVLPSVSEPWGLVVNEAMAAGLPVLVSRKCGCYPDLVKDGENGFSFDPYDTDELRSKMRDMVQGKADLDKMGKRSLEIIQEYTPVRAAQIVVNTIKTCSGK